MSAAWPVRRHFLIFLLLSGFAFAQLVWWVIFQVEEGNRLQRVQHGLWDQQIEIAGQQHLRMVGNADAFNLWIASHFPDLQAEANSGRITVRPEALQRLDRIAAGRVRMFVSEGSFFIFVLLVGITFMYRTLQREIAFERRQSVFLAATSHELKTPITSLRLYTETLRDRELPPAQRADLFATMQSDLERLTALIDRLLQAQAIADDKRGHLELTDLSEETRLCVNEFNSSFGLKGLQLRMDFAPAVQALVDPDRWQVVIRNLLDNAAKYSPQGGTISVTLTRDNRWARLEVSDQGIGFERSEAGRLFDRFYRVGNEDTRRTAGTGLGLHLVEGIVRSFKGRVGAHSPGPGRGATFTVELPLARERPHE